MDEQQWYDLFEDVASKLRHGNLTRQQQHAELKRIVFAECERCAVVAESWHDDYADPGIGPRIAWAILRPEAPDDSGAVQRAIVSR